MARLIKGDDDTFDYLVHGNYSSRVTEFISDRMDRLERLSPTLFDAGSSFVSRAREAFDSFIDSKAMHYAKAALRTVKSMWGSDTIRVLMDVEETQSAKKRQQKAIMSHPAVRALFHKGKVEGYAESYVDDAPGVIGEEHYMYRRTMHGQVVECGEDGEDWKSTTYDEILDDPGDFMDPDEIVNHELTMDVVLLALARRQKDPTSRYGADL